MSIVDVYADAAKLKENSGLGRRRNNLIKAPITYFNEDVVNN
jgi:hypothetical protein